MAKRGHRPTYKPEYAEMAGTICAETGAIDVNLAKIFKVTERCIRKWKVDHPEFEQALRDGKDTFDTANVEEKLLTRALGYTYTEKTYQKHPKTGKLTLIKEVTKEVPPDVTAQIYWTKNRNRERWSDARQIDLEVGKSTMSMVAKFLNQEANGTDK